MYTCFYTNSYIRFLGSFSIIIKAVIVIVSVDVFFQEKNVFAANFYMQAQNYVQSLHPIIFLRYIILYGKSDFYSHYVLILLLSWKHLENHLHRVILSFKFIRINIRCSIALNTWYFLWRCIAATKMGLLRNITNVSWHFYALG